MVGRVGAALMGNILPIRGARGGERGRLHGWDDEVVAVGLEMEPEQVRAIREAMQGKTLDGDNLPGWRKRNPKREDNSSERVRAHRERSRVSEHDVTHGNAPERAGTLEESREEEKKKEDATASLSGSDKPNADLVKVVWANWVETSGRKATLTKERRSKIKTRLNTFSVEKLCAAIESAHRNPFYLGENDRETYFGNIETIFKNDTAVTAHLEWAQENPPARRLTLHQGGLVEGESASADRRAAAEADHAADLDAWRKDVSRRFAREPAATRQQWKDRVSPDLAALKGHSWCREFMYKDSCALYVESYSKNCTLFVHASYRIVYADVPVGPVSGPVS